MICKYSITTVNQDYYFMQIQIFHIDMYLRLYNYVLYLLFIIIIIILLPLLVFVYIRRS